MMIWNQEQSVLISSMGWVDHGALWCFETASARVTRIELGDARYLSLKAGLHDHFAVVHHFNRGRLEVTVHRFALPGKVVARAVLRGNTQALEGDVAAWAYVPKWFVAYFAGPFWSDFALVTVDPRGKAILLQTLEWYNDDYDKGYQGIVDVVEVLERELVIVSLQRDSRPVLYDPVNRRKVGYVQLADQHGNPHLYFRRTAHELWADDYDTLVKIDPSDWRVLAAVRLQDAADGVQQFIGDFAFDLSESLCAVARPFSGDVVKLDPATLSVAGAARTGGQPLQLAVLSDGRVYARDWKTGELLAGKFDSPLGV